MSSCRGVTRAHAQSERTSRAARRASHRYAASAACPGTGKEEGYPLYNVTSRECWNKKCGATGAEEDAFDCFEGSLTYQHSPSEGLADVLEACAVDAYPERLNWWPFVYCLEGLKLNYCPCGSDCALDDCALHYTGAPQIYLRDYSPEPTANATYVKGSADAYIAASAEECAGTVGLSYSPIAACAFKDRADPSSWPGARGEVLEKKAASATAHLKPEHGGVPWVVVDGMPLANTTLLLETVCDAAQIKGLATPPGCN